MGTRTSINTTGSSKVYSNTRSLSKGYFVVGCMDLECHASGFHELYTRENLSYRRQNKLPKCEVECIRGIPLISDIEGLLSPCS